MRCDWSLSMIYQITDKWMTSQENCFLCFVQHDAQFWNVCEIVSEEASESLVKRLAGANKFTKKKNWRNRNKKSSWQNWRMPKLQEIFTTIAIHMCHRYERLTVLQNVFVIILLWESQDIKKLFEETVDKEEKKSRRKIKLGTYKKPKLTQILEQSSGKMQVSLCVPV